jgi:hypothetical protein
LKFRQTNLFRRENVSTLLSLLRQNALRCAIVYDTEKLHIGFVDVLDICTHILNVTQWRKDLPEDSFKSLVWEGQWFTSEQSGNLMSE